MPEAIVDIHPDVLDLDVQEIANYIMSENAVAAAMVLDAIDRTYHLLASQPRIGTEYSPLRRILKGIRMMVVTEYPNYLIYFRPLPEDAGVRILYVLHAARDAAAYARSHRRH